MATLYAGPWVGEFGWELFCWQGWIRQRAIVFDETFVACRRGHEILYEDFANVISQDIKGEECDMWNCKGFESGTIMQTFDRTLGPHDVWVKSCQPVLRYDHTHRLNNESLFARFRDQTFVKFGESSSERAYDVVIHARAKKNKVNAGMNSDYRNWPAQKWSKLIGKLKGYSIACVGTKEGALHVGGEDLRGVSLRSLCNTLASSGIIVGPSSGPMHLAALCACPQVLWYGPPYDKLNEQRYTIDWNPHRTSVDIIRHDKWDADVDDVAQRILKRLENENENDKTNDIS